MKINLQLSEHEAFLVSSVLDFVRRNLVFDDRNGGQRFVAGGQFTCNTRDLMDISYLAALINEERADSVNFHPFNPFLNSF